MKRLIFLCVLSCGVACSTLEKSNITGNVSVEKDGVIVSVDDQGVVSLEVKTNDVDETDTE